MRKLLALAIVLAVALTLASVLGETVQAGHVACGDTLTADTTLDSDLNCTTTPGLIIGADGITLDLNGFTVTGSACGGCHGIRIVGFIDVTIKNGTVVGFEQGIRGEGVSRLIIKDLTLTGQTSSHAIDILDSEDVEIKDTSISLVTTFIGPEAIRLESVDGVEVKNVHVDGGFIGVNFACGLCDGSELPTNGMVADSTFEGTFIGVLIANSSDARVENNEIGLVSGGVDLFGVVPSRGIRVGDFLPNTGTKIVGNQISNYGYGILANDMSASKIHGNIATGNSVDGIRLQAGSAGNKVTGNTATGNSGFDLSDVTCPAVENKWKGNTFGTRECTAIQ